MSRCTLIGSGSLSVQPTERGLLTVTHRMAPNLVDWTNRRIEAARLLVQAFDMLPALRTQFPLLNEDPGIGKSLAWQDPVLWRAWPSEIPARLR
jgi:hypothetical protein